MEVRLFFSFFLVATLVSLSLGEDYEEGECQDTKPANWCNKRLAAGKCSKIWAAKRCLDTCGYCDQCVDIYPAARCQRLKARCEKKPQKCKIDVLMHLCKKTFEFCDDDEEPEPPTAAPTEPPTEAPTEPPTAAPTEPPTAAPTEPPTAAPTEPPTAAPTEPPTAAPTEPPTQAPTQPPTTPSGYKQEWLRGDAAGSPVHVHEGLRLADGSGWVGIGETIFGETPTPQVVVRRVNNAGSIQWTKSLGPTSSGSASVGYSVSEADGKLFLGVGLWQSNVQKAAVVALDVSNGNTLWTTFMPGSTSSNKHGGVRSVITDSRGGQLSLAATGYLDCPEKGFLFVADESKPVVWKLNPADGSVLKTNVMSIEGLPQGAKIRRDLKTSGYVVASTGFGNLPGGGEDNVVFLVKVSSDMALEWSQYYGQAGGASQCFDILVDNDGNYLLGGHTTAGNGVVNWDFLALKVNSDTKQVAWRKTYGQPRNFDARYIHDEMYGVALDPAGNYLLLGGSGDEFDNYSQTTNSHPITSSDIWGSYLVVVDPAGNKLYEGLYGLDGANNAGEYLAVDNATGDIMVFADSDSTAGGLGFLLLKPEN